MQKYDTSEKYKEALLNLFDYTVAHPSIQHTYKVFEESQVKVEAYKIKKEVFSKYRFAWHITYFNPYFITPKKDHQLEDWPIYVEKLIDGLHYMGQSRNQLIPGHYRKADILQRTELKEDHKKWQNKWMMKLAEIHSK